MITKKHYIIIIVITVVVIIVFMLALAPWPGLLESICVHVTMTQSNGEKSGLVWV